MAEFNSIGIIGRLDSEQAVYSLRRLIRYLESRQVKLLLEERTATVLPGNTQEVVDREELGRQCDLVMVVGGDGSMLGAAGALARYNVPLLGVNQGRLGFLTDITPDEIERRVGEVLEGKYLMETRFMLGMAAIRDGKTIGGGEALNDVVMHPGQFIRMIEFELYIDDQFVYTQRSDGLIISTPTGSTAYALSAGGPLVHPRMDAIVLVPMNPHTLSSRSIVVDGSSEIKLVVGEHNTAFPHITCDGHNHVVSEPGDEIHVHKHPWKLQLIHPLNHNFYETCRSKLGWQSHITKQVKS
ncbi:NAD(+) kinase [Gilvimarinus sp. F26214L]|uniref:NAD(+) kinase n=1 Tax=Gilvimarinus sp. DZF01 TaxID=3461371 RepID=UPI004045BCAF